MKLTIRNTKVRDDRGQMVGAMVLGNGSIADEVDSWLTNNPDAIADAASQDVSDWLEDNITQPTNPVIDASLSVSGAAADAKKTGDELSDLKSALNDTVNLNSLVSPINVASWLDNKAVFYFNGNINNSTNFKCTDYLKVTPGSVVVLPMPVYKSSAGQRASFGLCFYDSEQVYIPNAGYQMSLAGETNTAEVIALTVPSNAAYMRTTWYRDDYSGYEYTGEFFITQYPTPHSRTQIVLGQDEINEYYGITSEGITSLASWGVTSYIDCKDVIALHVKMPVLAASVQNVIGLDFYDQNKEKISFVPANRGNANGAEMRDVLVPSNACYFRCTYWKYENAITYGEWYCSFETTQYGKNRPYQSGYIFYSPLVNQSVNSYWETDQSTELELDLKPTTGVLLLPDSYTPTGKPTPVIMYFHGYSHYVYYDHWGADEDFRTQKAQWAAQGFAVIDCNGARNNNMVGQFTSGGSLQYSDGYRKCYEYVKEHYNVEDKCHIICASAGGIPGINYCYWFNDVKSLQMLSAWTSLENNAYYTGQTASMVEYLGCDFTDGYEATKDKTIGFDPTLRIITIDSTKYLPQGKVPMKAFLGSTEEGDHIWNALQNYVTALRNAGQSVSLRIVEGATHKNICSDDNLALNTEYANFCKSV